MGIEILLIDEATGQPVSSLFSHQRECLPPLRRLAALLPPDEKTILLQILKEETAQ